MEEVGLCFMEDLLPEIKIDGRGHQIIKGVFKLKTFCESNSIVVDQMESLDVKELKYE